jgi:VanZ family protein
MMVPGGSRQSLFGLLHAAERRLPGVSAVLFSATVVLSAPFMGQIRAWLRSAFPAQFVVIVGSAVAAAIGLVIVVALVRIRDRRLLRYGLIAAALILGFAYNAALATGNPETDAVERVHFVEYGFITLLFYRMWRPVGDPSIFILPVLAGVIVGTAEEWFQWFMPVRIGEVRDVGLNLVAVSCGLLFSAGVNPPGSFTRHLRAGSLARLGAVASAALLVLAAFVHAVHLGYAVTRDGIGSFKSKYRAEQLHALAADRAVRWRSHPPVAFRRFSREDQYMDEGLWHIRRRNEAWAADDRATAWKENQILEAFFAPVLDTPSYVSATGHRWHADQRAAAERAGADAASAYVSRAEPVPIALWPTAVFWSVVGAVVVLLAGSCWILERRRRSGALTPDSYAV